MRNTGLDERTGRGSSGSRGRERAAVGRGPSGNKGRDPSAPVTDHPDVAAGTDKSLRRMKLLIIVGAVLFVISGGTLALVYGLSDRYDSKTNHDDLLGDTTRNQNTNIGTGPLNYLVLGMDAREGEQALDASAVRSDTMLLVHITKGLGSAFIVSIPRDSYVNIPAAGSWPGGKDKINAAIAYGGASLTAKTVFNLSQIPVDGAMIINFAGVVNMVDAVGGVHVCVPYDVPNFFQEFPQYANGWAEGCHDMMGEEAEVFMRQRHDVPGGDFGRIKSQQLVMKALAEKATSAGVLTNLGKLDSLLVTAAESLTIDNSMNLRDLAFALKGINPGNITFATAPYVGTMTADDGSSAVQLNLPECQVLFQAVLEDKTAEWLAAHPQSAVASYQGG